MANDFLHRAPQGAPRGLLIHWMLTRIARKPTYGFEILREIDSKTDGVWRPGPGSVYPILKKMLKAGYVEAEQVGKGRPDQRLYKITPKGVEHIQEAREVFRRITKNWGAMRGIFVDLVEPGSVPEFVLNGTAKQFELVKEVLEKQREMIGTDDFRTLLVEYSTLLNGQSRWALKESALSPRDRTGPLRPGIGARRSHLA